MYEYIKNCTIHLTCSTILEKDGVSKDIPLISSEDSSAVYCKSKSDVVIRNDTDKNTIVY